jgi:hypothetical protein
VQETREVLGKGAFLTRPLDPDDLFTRDELSGEQLLFGQTAAEFMRKEVLPHEHRLEEARTGRVVDDRAVSNAFATRFDRNEALDKAWAAVLEHRGIDSVAARQRIGDAAIQAVRSPF